MAGIKERFYELVTDTQREICTALEEIDGKAKFHEDPWERDEGGGGLSKVITDGHVFEKGGVNVSAVHGELPAVMARNFDVPDSRFYACGVSLVIHPQNPFVPTVHANFRYFELYNMHGQLQDQWFGGGADLTPYYLFKEDAKHFHESFKAACDLFGEAYYPRFKKDCDEYFVNRHRHNEARGIGGIFYDYLRPDEAMSAEDWFNFSKANAKAFLKAYLPIVEKRKDIDYTDVHREWQAYRRGRYVEFNLIHDRGTLFGLKTNGRIESILMSLPPIAKWKYNYQPEEGSPEAELMKYLKPVDWVGEIKVES